MSTENPTPQETATMDAAINTPLTAPAAGFLGEEILRAILPSEVDPIIRLVDDATDGGAFDTENIWASVEAVAALGRKLEAYLAGKPKVGSIPQAAAEAGSIAAGSTADLARGALAAAEPYGRPLAAGDGAAIQPVTMNPILAAILMKLAQEALAKLLNRLKS